MGIAVNGFRLILVHDGTTCHSLNKLCFVSHLVSTLWLLYWAWVGSAPGSDESVSVHMNKHFNECHKMDISWDYSLAANITKRPQPLIVSKLNINVSLADKWCLLSFCFILHSKDLNRHKHSVAVGAERHPEQPKANRTTQCQLDFPPSDLVAA